jgi:LPS export ABC transporter protein LptC
LKKSDNSSYLKKLRNTKRIFLGFIVLSNLMFFGYLGYKTIVSTNLNLVFIKLVASTLNSINVKPAVISGVTSGGLKYYITSKTLKNYFDNVLNDSNIVFDEPFIILENKDGTQATLNAQFGNFFEENKEIVLENNIIFKSENGYDLKTNKVFINFKNQNIYSKDETFLFYDNNTLQSSGFSLNNNFNNIVINGPIDIAAESNIRLDGNLYIDQINKRISTEHSFLIDDYSSKTTVSADSIEIFYTSLNNIKTNIKNQNLSNFKRIFANGNFILKLENGFLKGDTYIYEAEKKIMIVRSKDKPSTYEDDSIKVKVFDRFEFLENKNLVVLRGNPIVEFKEKNNKQGYIFKANLIYGKLNNERNEIQYMEAFDNVKLTMNPDTIISGNYAYYDKIHNLITIEDNIVVKNSSGITTGCKIIIDTEKEITKLIPCGNKPISGRINKS